MPDETSRLAIPQIVLFKYGIKFLSLPKTFTFDFFSKINLSSIEISPIIWNSISGYFAIILGKVLFIN